MVVSLVNLGRLDYAAALALQQQVCARRQQERIGDVLLLVEHPPVLTLGRNAQRRHVVASSELLARRGISLFETNRGGDVTYHGPGQLVGYPIFLLRDDERDLHVYLRNLEEALIRACARFDLPGERKVGWTGVWTTGGARKLASIGVAVKRWVTMHGFALNVSTDLRRFAAINPCGLDAAVMGSMAGELGRPIPLDAVKAALRDTFSEVFARRFD